MSKVDPDVKRELDILKKYRLINERDYQNFLKHSGELNLSKERIYQIIYEKTRPSNFVEQRIENTVDNEKTVKYESENKELYTKAQLARLELVKTKAQLEKVNQEKITVENKLNNVETEFDKIKNDYKSADSLIANLFEKKNNLEQDLLKAQTTIENDLATTVNPTGGNAYDFIDLVSAVLTEIKNESTRNGWGNLDTYIDGEIKEIDNFKSKILFLDETDGKNVTIGKILKDANVNADFKNFIFSGTPAAVHIFALDYKVTPPAPVAPPPPPPVVVGAPIAPVAPPPYDIPIKFSSNNNIIIYCSNDVDSKTPADEPDIVPGRFVFTPTESMLIILNEIKKYYLNPVDVAKLAKKIIVTLASKIDISAIPAAASTIVTYPPDTDSKNDISNYLHTLDAKTAPALPYTSDNAAATISVKFGADFGIGPDNTHGSIPKYPRPNFKKENYAAHYLELNQRMKKHYMMVKYYGLRFGTKIPELESMFYFDDKKSFTDDNIEIGAAWYKIICDLYLEQDYFSEKKQVETLEGNPVAKTTQVKPPTPDSAENSPYVKITYQPVGKWKEYCDNKIVHTAVPLSINAVENNIHNLIVAEYNNKAKIVEDNLSTDILTRPPERFIRTHYDWNAPNYKFDDFPKYVNAYYNIYKTGIADMLLLSHIYSEALGYAEMEKILHLCSPDNFIENTYKNLELKNVPVAYAAGNITNRQDLFNSGYVISRNLESKNIDLKANTMDINVASCLKNKADPNLFSSRFINVNKHFDEINSLNPQKIDAKGTPTPDPKINNNLLHLGIAIYSIPFSFYHALFNSHREFEGKLLDKKQAELIRDAIENLIKSANKETLEPSKVYIGHDAKGDAEINVFNDLFYRIFSNANFVKNHYTQFKSIPDLLTMRLSSIALGSDSNDFDITISRNVPAIENGKVSPMFIDEYTCEFSKLLTRYIETGETIKYEDLAIKAGPDVKVQDMAPANMYVIDDSKFSFTAGNMIGVLDFFNEPVKFTENNIENKFLHSALYSYIRTIYFNEQKITTGADPYVNTKHEDVSVIDPVQIHTAKGKPKSKIPVKYKGDQICMNKGDKTEFRRILSDFLSKISNGPKGWIFESNVAPPPGQKRDIKNVFHFGPEELEFPINGSNEFKYSLLETFNNLLKANEYFVGDSKNEFFENLKPLYDDPDLYKKFTDPKFPNFNIQLCSYLYYISEDIKAHRQHNWSIITEKYREQNKTLLKILGDTKYNVTFSLTQNGVNTHMTVIMNKKIIERLLEKQYTPTEYISWLFNPIDPNKPGLASKSFNEYKRHLKSYKDVFSFSSIFNSIVRTSGHAGQNPPGTIVPNAGLSKIAKIPFPHGANGALTNDEIVKYAVPAYKYMVFLCLYNEILDYYKLKVVDATQLDNSATSVSGGGILKSMLTDGIINIYYIIIAVIIVLLIAILYISFDKKTTKFKDKNVINDVIDNICY